MNDRVVVVGGGMAGLATAYRLLQADLPPEVTVIEADDRLGGRLRSVSVGGLDLDAGPDSFVARKPWAADLARELGLKLVAPSSEGAFVWTERGLTRMPAIALGVPADTNELLRWRGLSRAGRARALADLVRKARPRNEDESLGALLRRRLGDEATDRLVGPVLGGLFAGDVDRLGVRATFPELAGWERDVGSLIRGASSALASARDSGPLFLRPADGMTGFVEALAEAVGITRIRISSAAAAVRHEGPELRIDSAGGGLPADAIVLATPAHDSARMLAESAPDAAARLAEIAYVSTGVVLLVYPEGTAVALPDSTGFVVPTGAAPMTAATFLSRKWPDPAFAGRAVVRCFVGAAGSEDVLDAENGDIVEAVCRHLSAALPLPDRPTATAVVRWPRSMPQYEVGHLDRVAAIEDSLPPGIFVVGNAYRGVGIADTVRGADEAAGRVREYLAAKTIGAERVR